MPILWISKVEWEATKKRIDKLEQRNLILNPYEIQPEPTVPNHLFGFTRYMMSKPIDEVLNKFFYDWRLLLDHLGVKFVDSTSNRKIEKEK